MKKVWLVLHATVNCFAEQGRKFQFAKTRRHRWRRGGRTGGGRKIDRWIKPNRREAYRSCGIVRLQSGFCWTTWHTRWLVFQGRNEPRSGHDDRDKIGRNDGGLPIHNINPMNEQEPVTRCFVKHPMTINAATRGLGFNGSPFATSTVNDRAEKSDPLPFFPSPFFDFS